MRRLCSLRCLLFPSLAMLVFAPPATPEPLATIRVSNDGAHFVNSDTGEPFIVWGVNYDHDTPGRLLDEYWIDDWATVVEDFREIQQLGANCVRIHLQLGKFMDAPNAANPAALAQLAKLVALAEQTGLYLNITGLACYHRENIPDWYDALAEAERWAVQARFWEAIAGTCRESPAVFCYDLMNEPILPGKQPETEWLTGELGGKFFVQRLALNLKGRDRKQIAAAWVDKMVAAIRSRDQQHLVTVGVIPWVFVFGGGEPLFYSPEVGRRLDFVSVHFYPERGKIDAALKALQAYEVGKPLVIEETFPLRSGSDELVQFIRRSASHADGWISFYWGTPPEELKTHDTMAAAITSDWLEVFRDLAPDAKAGRLAVP